MWQCSVLHWVRTVSITTQMCVVMTAAGRDCHHLRDCLLGPRDGVHAIADAGRWDAGITQAPLSALYLSTRIVGLSDLFFFSSRRRHTRFDCDWSSDVCSSD